MTSLLSGVLLAAMPHCTSIYILYIVCGFYGLLTATMVALSPTIMALLIGKEKLSSALGINMFVYGVMSLAGQYKAEHFRDFANDFQYFLRSILSFLFSRTTTDWRARGLPRDFLIPLLLCRR